MLMDFIGSVWDKFKQKRLKKKISGLWSGPGVSEHDVVNKDLKTRYGEVVFKEAQEVLMSGDVPGSVLRFDLNTGNAIGRSVDANIELCASELWHEREDNKERIAACKAANEERKVRSKEMAEKRRKYNEEHAVEIEERRAAWKAWRRDTFFAPRRKPFKRVDTL